MNKAASLLLAVLFSQQHVEALVGDFSPLQIGNVWRYGGIYRQNDDIGQSNAYSSTRRMEILSKVMQTDTSVFRVALLDSLYNRYSITRKTGTAGYDTTTYPDSQAYFEIYVLELPDSTLRVNFNGKRGEEMLGYAFRSHTYPDSLVRNQTMVDSSGRDLPANWGDCTYDYSARMYLQDVGMGGYRYQQAACVGGYRLTYSLYSFNGVIVTAIENKKLRIGKRTYFRPGIMAFFGRNLLGRKDDRAGK